MEMPVQAELAALTHMIIATYEHSGKQRFLLGITGIPAAGKSTLADRLMKNLNRVLRKDIAIVVPMDGFHYCNEILTEKNLLSRKGIPETFDAKGFVDLVKRIARNSAEKINCPSYNRQLHGPVPDAITIENKHRIIIIEGNYLLLPDSPWNELAHFLNEVWFIDTPIAVARERLMERHVRSGYTAGETVEKIHTTDIPNAELIIQTRGKADKIITLHG